MDMSDLLRVLTVQRFGTFPLTLYFFKYYWSQAFLYAGQPSHVMHLSMSSPRGGSWVYVGNLTFIAIPTHGNFTKSVSKGRDA